jgi:hypothetical protein
MPEIYNGKFRHRKVKFAQISNSALQDAQLSLKAKGLYSLIQSYITMPDYDLYKWNLIKQCKDGEKAFQSAWQELKDTGYLKQFRIPSGKKGQFCYEYDLLDEPDLTTPSMLNLNRSGEAAKGEEGEKPDHTPQKGVYGQSVEISDQVNVDHTPHLAPYAQRTECSEHPMLNGGYIRNTEPNNTESNNTKSVRQSTDGQTDEIRKGLKAQIEYDYFEDNYPEEVAGIAAIIECMVDMLARRQTKINGVNQSQDSLKAYIDRVDSCTILEFLEHMRSKNPSGIKNINAYWQTALINYLREKELLLVQI